MKKIRPLYSEHEKKGYIRIKIAQPNVWMMKSKWVWLETHPWMYSEIKDSDVFVFLDGNNRNFFPDNIERISRGELALVNRNGGFEKGNPELNKLKIAKVKLTSALLDAGERANLVIKSSNYRVLKSTAVANTKRYYNRHKDEPEFKARMKRYRDNRSEEQKQRQREYQHNWYLANKNNRSK